jgi:hypothetical protein
MNDMSSIPKYCIGAFGFMALDELRNENADHSTGELVLFVML